MAFKFVAAEHIDGGEELLPDNTQVLLSIRDARLKKNPTSGTVSLVLALTVVGGEFNRHRFDYRITTECTNPKAVQIGKQQLARICRACGIEGFEIEDDLVGLKFNAIAKVRPAKGEYRASQEIAPIETQAQQARAATPKPATPVQPIASKVWIGSTEPIAPPVVDDPQGTPEEMDDDIPF